MRSLARWTIVIAIFCTVVFAGAAPVFDHAVRATSPAAASSDGASSGFKSQPAPEKPAYIGPGVAIAGSTFSTALVPSSFVAGRLYARTVAASPSAPHASRVSPHLRSIPLLI